MTTIQSPTGAVTSVSGTGGTVTPWTIGTLLPLGPGRIFMNPARLSRAQATWASPAAGAMTTLVNLWKTAPTSGQTGMYYALRSLLASSSADATSAYNAATGEAYSIEQSPRALYADSAPFVYSYC